MLRLAPIRTKRLTEDTGVAPGHSPWRRNLVVSVVATVLVTALIAFLNRWLFPHEPIDARGSVNVLQSAVIGISYLVIAVALLVLAKRAGKHLPFFWAFIVFGVFVVSGAVSSAMSVINVWYPVPAVMSVAASFRAVVSLVTAVSFAAALPRILPILRSAASVQKKNDELTAINRELVYEMRERERFQERSRIQLTRLRAVLDALPFGAAVLDENQVVLHVNQQCCDLLQIDTSPGELVGRPASMYLERLRSQLLRPDEYLEDVQGALASGKPIFDAELQLRDGRIIERDTIPIIENGAPLGCLFVSRDVTRDRRVDSVKSEFMSLASHQLRTPLTSIRWSLGRLNKVLNGKLSDQEAELLSEAHGGSRRMANTIDTMLAISRVEAGRVSLEPSDVKLGVLLNDVRVECRDLYEKKSQTFTLDCEPNAYLRTDESVLQEILSNLYTNAIKYTQPGGSVSVRGALQLGRVTIEVKDNGYGIPLAQQGKVFTKFFRGDNIVKKDTEGTGLGLYLVHLLVKMLHGTITFSSREGEGTTFTVSLPSAI